MARYRVEGNVVTFWLKVKPHAARQFLELDPAGEMRLHVHPPATEGQANAACIEFFARALRLPGPSVAITSGRKSTRKLIRIIGRSAQDTIDRVNALAAKGSAQEKRSAEPS